MSRKCHVNAYNPSSEPYLVIVRTSEGTEIEHYEGYPDTGGWSQREIRFYFNGSSSIRIEVHPTSHGNQSAFGAVWIAEMQLELVDPGWINDFATLDDVPISSYHAVLLDMNNASLPCITTNGRGMRSKYRRYCVCLNVPDGDCGSPSADVATRECFWQMSFNISLDEIERGNLIPSNNIAVGNFNYRQARFALNFVGTNVRDCVGSNTPSTCYSNAFVPYSLEQFGVVPIRNYSGDTIWFDMPTGLIEHGKGLAAEILVTNPITSSSSGLLSSYYKDGLRGRPLQGKYVLRVWETPELIWEAVEDIQLIFDYRYWTRMSEL
jgi:hypothetical protein